MGRPGETQWEDMSRTQACTDGMHDACPGGGDSVIGCVCVCHGKPDGGTVEQGRRPAPERTGLIGTNPVTPALMCVNTQCRVVTFKPWPVKTPAVEGRVNRCPACYGVGKDLNS